MCAAHFNNFPVIWSSVLISVNRERKGELVPVLLRITAEPDSAYERFNALASYALIMTCDIFGTRQTNTLTLCYLLGKTYKPAHSSATLESLKSTRSTKLLEKLLT